MWRFFFLLLWATPVWAVEVCTTIDTSTWTQEQKNLRQAITYTLSYAADPLANKLPTLKGDQVCFQDPPFDVPTIITGQKILDQYGVNKAASDAASQAEQARQQVFTDELATNTLCQAELADLDARIDQLFDSVTTLAEAKTAMKIALKRVARCVRARAR